MKINMYLRTHCHCLLNFLPLHLRYYMVNVHGLIYGNLSKINSDLCYAIMMSLIMMQNCCISLYTFCVKFKLTSFGPLNSPFIELTYNAIIIFKVMTTSVEACTHIFYAQYSLLISIKEIMMW